MTTCKETADKGAGLTRAQTKLLDASDVIFKKAATEKDAAYMARELVQCTLPHRNPGNDKPAWTRRNGNLILTIRPGWDSKKGGVIGYPYGTIPRLLLFWIITEAIRRKSRRLELGHSLNEFMNELGLSVDTGGGKRSDARRLREQMERLFRAIVSFESVTSTSWIDMQIAPKGQLWWDVKNPSQDTLWGSWIELSEDFYNAITAAPVPVDMRALYALKRSPLALDLYAWLTYTSFCAHKSGKPRFETWEQLHGHMGGEYARMDNFRASAKVALNKIRLVYPKLKLGHLVGGIEVLPESFPALQPREHVTVDATPRRSE